MKKIILMCSLLTTVVTLNHASAQQNAPATPGGPQASQPMSTPESVAQNKANNWDRLLTLTPDQRKSVYEAELESTKMAFAIKTSGARPTQEQMQQMRTTKDEKFKAILTPEQWTRYSAITSHKPIPAPASATGAQKQ